jgi:hypothetical protein
MDIVLWSSLWNLYDNACDKLYTTWNIAVRRLCDLPWMAHTRFLSHIAGIAHVNLNLKCRFVKFLSKAINSANERVSFLAKLCMTNTLSVTGSNVSNILCEYNLCMSDIISGNASMLMKNAYICASSIPDEMWKCDMILELTDCMYGISKCGLSNEEAKQCVQFLAS